MACADDSNPAELAGHSEHVDNTAVGAGTPPPPRCADCAGHRHDWFVSYLERQVYGGGQVRLYRRLCLCKWCVCDGYQAFVVPDAAHWVAEPTEDHWITTVLPVVPSRQPPPAPPDEAARPQRGSPPPWVAPPGSRFATDAATARAVLDGLRNL